MRDDTTFEILTSAVPVHLRPGLLSSLCGRGIDSMTLSSSVPVHPYNLADDCVPDSVIIARGVRTIVTVVINSYVVRFPAVCTTYKYLK